MASSEFPGGNQSPVWVRSIGHKQQRFCLTNKKEGKKEGKKTNRKNKERNCNNELLPKKDKTNTFQLLCNQSTFHFYSFLLISIHFPSLNTSLLGGVLNKMTELGEFVREILSIGFLHIFFDRLIEEVQVVIEIELRTVENVCDSVFELQFHHSVLNHGLSVSKKRAIR
jgi:hypothetical protein